MAEKYPYLAHTNDAVNAVGRQGFKSGGGSGMDGNMEARVKALEEKFEKMDSKLDAIGKDLARLSGKVDMLPTTLQLGGFVLAVLAIAGLAKYLAP